jgi:hypothetical protein
MWGNIINGIKAFSITIVFLAIVIFLPVFMFLALGGVIFIFMLAAFKEAADKKE